MRNIVLLCAAGMSTSLLVTKMREAAVKEGYACEINAYSTTEAKRVGESADIVLLGPQVRFQLNQIKGIVSCPVEAIDMSAYGMMNGAAVIKRVKEVLNDE